MPPATFFWFAAHDLKLARRRVRAFFGASSPLKIAAILGAALLFFHALAWFGLQMLFPQLFTVERTVAAAALLTPVATPWLVNEVEWTPELTLRAVTWLSHVTGLPIDRSSGVVTLVDSKGEKSTVPEAEIDALEESTVSLMPDNLYRQFKPQELRDLFAYLQSQPAAQ